jgi:hypothetical protein
MFELWLEGLKPSTREIYGRYLRRLFKAANMTPEQVVDGSKKDVQTYVDLVQLANKFTERGRYIAIFALRRLLYDRGVLMLPPARTHTPTAARAPTCLTWEEAHAIVAAAAKPYNVCFKLMLHAGWGIGEFLKFNNEDNWNSVKAQLAKEPEKEYYKHDFTGRKKNTKEWYSLIPTSILREVLDVVSVPIRATHGYIFEGERRTHKTKGIVLNSDNYHSARIYLEKAWITARKRAAVTLKGQPTLHELRDTWRTKAAFVGCADDAAEFAMGHTIDPLHYKKVYMKENWMWENLRKIEGDVVTENDLQERDQTIEKLQQQIDALRGQFETILKTKITKET